LVQFFQTFDSILKRLRVHKPSMALEFTGAHFARRILITML
jgi:hypothetical protein